MRHFCTNALPDEVKRIAPEAIRVERNRGMTTFVLRERDVWAAISELHRADIRVDAGWPRVSYSSPRAYATTASHIRLR